MAISQPLTRPARLAVCYLLEELTRVPRLNASEFGFLDVIEGGSLADAQALAQLAREVRIPAERLPEAQRAVYRLALLVRVVDKTNVRQRRSHTVLLDAEGHRCKMIAGAFSLTITVENLARALTETFNVDPQQVKTPVRLFVDRDDVTLATELWDASWAELRGRSGERPRPAACVSPHSHPVLLE